MKKNKVIAILIFSTIVFYSCNDHAQKNKIEIAKVDTNVKNKYPPDTADHIPVIDLKYEKFPKEKLQPIVAIFSGINATKNWTVIKQANLNVSTEGGDVTYYFKDSTLKKAVVRIYGETGKVIKEYYLDKNKLVFVYEKEYKYNRPIYYDSSKMKEFNDTTFFDINKSAITEDRSYFENGILIHQSNNQDCGSPFDESYLKEEQKRIQDEFYGLPLIH